MSADRPHISKNWYRHAFDVLYPVVYAHRTAEAARPEAEFAARALPLQAGDKVLDLACGNGRHMARLVSLGCRVTGLDYSAALLDLARTGLGAEAKLVRGDMRYLPFREAFDAVTNFFTSFGYFDVDSENVRAACSIANALKPGGSFLIDHANRRHVESTLVPHSLRHSGAYDIAEERWMDGARNRVNKVTTILLDGEVIARTEESVRLYNLEELTSLLREGGLRVRRAYGDFSGSHYDESQPRLIVTGYKDSVGV